MQRTFRNAFPDVTITLDVAAVDSDVVRGPARVTGTATGDLDLGVTAPGTLAPTGRVVTMETSITWVVQDEKLFSATVTPEEGSGVQRLLTQLGLTPAQGRA